MDAEIIAVGTELLMGETLDTNSSWLASRFPSVGLRLQWVTQVGDDFALLTEALERAFQRSHFTFTIGGLGPTEDDLTRESIAKALGEDIHFDGQIVHQLKEYFKQRGVVMPPRNRKQAGIIPSAQFLPNPNGTAPGWWGEKNDHVIVALPGPPLEMQYMWEHQVYPRLQERRIGNIILSRNFKTIGLSEGAVDDMVSEFHGSQNPYLGTYSKPDGIHVRLIAQGATEEEARSVVHRAESRIREILGSSIWGMDDERLEEQAAQLLRQRHLTLATMQFCSGGSLASTLAEVPQGGTFFKGGVVTSTPETMVALGLDGELIRKHGVISREVAEAMAQVVRRHLGADIGIGVTGVEGPDEMDNQAVGTLHVAIARDEGVVHELHHLPPRRPLIRQRTVIISLLLLNRVLLGLPHG